MSEFAHPRTGYKQSKIGLNQPKLEICQIWLWINTAYDTIFGEMKVQEQLLWCVAGV